MKTEQSELLNAYTKLCGTRAEMYDAESLPQRYKAILAWQGDLSAFVLKYPKVLSSGVDNVLETLEEQERKRAARVLMAMGVKRHD